MPVPICPRKKLWTRTYSTRDQVPTCPIFTRAKIKSRYGTLKNFRVTPVITAFHSCCLSYHVFDQENLWPAWVGTETAIFWQCSPGTIETQRLYPLCHAPQRAIKVGFFGLINPIMYSPYLVFHSRVRTEFVIVFNWNHFEMRLLNLRINFLFYLLQTFCPHLGSFCVFTKKTTKMRTKSPQ